MCTICGSGLDGVTITDPGSICSGRCKCIEMVSTDPLKFVKISICFKS